MRNISVHRAYEPPRPDDGLRVLVDRLWPRGLAKADAHVDAWPKALAPSTELRRWYGHDPRRFTEFRLRYRRELQGEDARVAREELLSRAGSGPLTLLTATRDVEHSNAVVLADFLAHDGTTDGRPEARGHRAKAGGTST